MTRNLKALGLALLAIFALSAIAASGAQATAGVFTWESGTQHLTVEHDAEGGNPATGSQKFTTFVGQVQCQEMSGKVGVSGTESQEMTMQGVSFHNSGSTKCSGPLSSQPTFEMGNCDYKFTAGQTIDEMQTTGSAHIECTSGTIVINAPLCQIKVKAQKPTGGHVIYHTITAAKNYVTMEATVSEIHSVAQGFFCEKGTTTNGQYKGNVIVKGYKSDGVTQTNVEVH